MPRYLVESTCLIGVSSILINQYFSLNKYNMQKLWSGIRSIINIGKCKNSYITSILNNNKSVA